MTRARFEQLVSAALKTIPARFRREIRNVAVIVEDEPSPALLEDMEIEPPDTLFGLYQGTPLPERTWVQDTLEPDRITIFQGPIEDACDDEDEIVDTIGETVIHEFGHYFGLSEEEIEAIEERYWRGEEQE
jgi:predicted Zn-dependent protease with MMP-like domain